jgi:hypothetical protein
VSKTRRDKGRWFAKNRKQSGTKRDALSKHAQRQTRRSIAGDIRMRDVRA